MWFRKRLRNKVYRLYLKGVPIMNIALFLDLREEDVEEMIDYMNEIYA